MIKSRLKNATFLIGVLALFVGGLAFVILSDLSFKNNSGNLIISVLLCFGSAIIFFFANNYLEKPVIMYLMKGIGLALAIGLLVYLHWFSTSKFFLDAVEELRAAGLREQRNYAIALATMPITFALSYIGLAMQAVNIVLSAVLKDEVRAEKSNAQLPQTEPVAEAATESAPETDVE